MGLRFQIEKDKVVLTPQFFMFEEFVNIWKWDTSKNKDKAHKLVYFIFLLCDLSEANPNATLLPEDKEREAKYRAYKDRTKKFTEKEMSLLRPAIECYNKYSTTAEERLLAEFDTKSDEIIKVLDNTEPEQVTNQTSKGLSFVSNSKIITDALIELDTLKKTKQNVVSAIRQEAIDNKIRGGTKLTPHSRGLISLIRRSDEI